MAACPLHGSSAAHGCLRCCRGHAWKVRVTTPPRTASTVRATRNHRLHAAPCFGAAALRVPLVLKSAKRWFTVSAKSSSTLPESLTSTGADSLRQAALAAWRSLSIIRHAAKSPSRRLPLSSTLGSRLQRSGARNHRWAAVAAEYQMPFFLGAMAVLVNNGLVSLACGARRLQLWLSLRALRGWQCLHQVCRWLLAPALAHQPSPATGACGTACNTRSPGLLGPGRASMQWQVRRRRWPFLASELQRPLLKSLLARQHPWLPSEAAA